VRIMPVKTVSDLKTFEAEMESSDNILIKFEAEWCYPCKAMKPIMEDFASKNPDIKVLSVDIEGDGIYGILGKFDVKSVPTFILIKNGATTKRAVGTVTRVELSSLVEE